MADSNDILAQLLAGQNANPSQYTDFNSDYASAMRQIARQRAGISDLQNRSTTRLNEDFNKGIEDFTRGRDESVKTLQDYLATNGNLRSGANIERQGQIGEEFLRGITGLAQERTRSTEDLVSQLTAASQGLLEREESLNMQKARADSQQALEKAQNQAAMLANSQPVYQPDGTYAPAPSTYVQGPPTMPGAGTYNAANSRKHAAERRLRSGAN